MSADQVLDLALIHHVHLDAIASGTGDAQSVRQLGEGMVTFSRMAELRGDYVREMAEHLVSFGRVIDRLNETGRVAFEGDEYAMACEAVGLMDEIARTIDLDTARAAADWGERQFAIRCRSEAMAA